jgi:hypothetical protein
MSETVPSLISGSNGPRPNTSSTISALSRLISAALSGVFSCINSSRTIWPISSRAASIDIRSSAARFIVSNSF